MSRYKGYFSVMRDITTPTRRLSIENSVRDFNLVGVVMSRVTLIY